MLVRTSIALLLLTVLAGCSGSGPKDGAAADTADFSDLDVEATATTGVIRGIVVDERIIPIDGASVGVTGAGLQRNATSDAEGRFAFGELEPGTYFLHVSSLLHSSVQTSVEVVAGLSEPPVLKVQLARKFAQEPFVEQYKHDGFIQCNQAGVYYATAPCITDFTSAVGPNVNGTGPCTASGCAHQLRQVQDEERGFHVAVSPGWQTLIWEMTWEESSDTFERMGLTVSYNVTQRCACHNYLSVGSANPLRAQLDVGVDHENSNDNEPDLLYPEGRPDLYYFVGVRTGPYPVALAVNQQFQLFANFFYYGVPPAEWSFIEGDPMPF